MSEIDTAKITELALELNRLADEGVNETQRFLKASGKPLSFAKQSSLKVHYLCHFLVCADTLYSGKYPHLQQTFMDELIQQSIVVYCDWHLSEDVTDTDGENLCNFILETYNNHVLFYKGSPYRQEKVARQVSDWLHDLAMCFCVLVDQHIGEGNSQEVRKEIIKIRLSLWDSFYNAVSPLMGYKEAKSLAPRFTGASLLTMGGVLEIHFYQQEDVFLFTETNAPDEDAQTYLELVLLASYIVRQVSNLGPGEPSQAIGLLANTLAAVDTPLREGLAAFDAIRLVPYTGGPGRKRFICQLQYTPHHIGFGLKAEGFGLLARGVGAYALNSTIALVKHIVDKRRQNRINIHHVKLCLGMCGDFILQNHVRLDNHGALVRKVAEALIERG